ncbi:hypothetical protein [Alicyclobacillus sp. SO9]|uniref:hypothetical protein n=1 Tax=Alicyclobacillus sp. SO9 TaxID=2665646 RepID=UPI0018E8E9DA|nr:hypothetical protein [Alicyclobacillus sp. SO9]QQE80926.1 hypothetical protein GI364_11375 [Alicyclobacillus sp. SO9]
MTQFMQTPAAQNDLEKITQETMNLMKDATTTGFTTADGLTGFGLEPVAKLIYPLVTPFLNSIPRKNAGQGSAAARWKAITGFGYTKQRPSTSFGAAGNLVKTVEQDFVAPYAPLSLGDSVTKDAQTLARGFDNLRAKSGVKTLYELKTGEDVMAIGGQNFALEAIGTLTATYSSTGGSITNGGASAVTWKFAVAARTTEAYHYGGPGTTQGVNGDDMLTAASTAVTVSVPAGATTGSVALTVPALVGAVAYDWYTDNGTGGNLYYTGITTTVNAATITAAADTANAVAPTADNSADTETFNGYMATLVGAYSSAGMVTRGTSSARSSGSYITSLDAKTLTGNNGSIQEIDNVLLYLAQNFQVSPTRLVVNPQEAFNMTDKMFATGGYRVMLQAGKQQDALTGGTYVENYINKAWQGQMLKIVVDPHVAPGTIMGVTDMLPYPDNTISSVLEIETQEEYTQYEYAANRQTGAGGGPRYDYEVRSIEVFKNYFPAGGFLLQNVGNG